jgi:hypothetical protein
MPIIEVVIGLKSGDQSPRALPSARQASAVVPIDRTSPRPRVSQVERSVASLAHSAARVFRNRTGRGAVLVAREDSAVIVAVVIVMLLFRRARAPSD